jgi:hypothetical protein
MYFKGLKCENVMQVSEAQYLLLIVWTTCEQETSAASSPVRTTHRKVPDSLRGIFKEDELKVNEINKVHFICWILGRKFLTVHDV